MLSVTIIVIIIVILMRPRGGDAPGLPAQLGQPRAGRAARGQETSRGPEAGCRTRIRAT